MKGNISVHTQNIFPIIKKWLYSDKDIFLREIVSNACDAIAKHKRLAVEGVTSNDDYEISVVLDVDGKTVTVSDNGIGMTAEEIEKYITQIAFSGAEEFLEKYKDKDDAKSQIIGHFGLGFYSSFMVCDLVEIDTLSYVDGAVGSLWSCEGGTEYEISEGRRSERGTDIIMHISEENSEMLEYNKLREILTKYCAFLPVPIYLYKKGEEKGEKPLNNTTPLWLKKPSECTDEEYKEFYSSVFFDFTPPLFWIHLNVDFPFNLKGILYFPKLKHEFELNEGQIKLYNNQVFVADNIKEVIPEFLLLLKGCIDCPDLPLNVSRSFLQNDGYVQKVNAHITKKVADKLTSLFNTDREVYNKFWDDINPFVKYGCLRDDKFYEKVEKVLLFKTVDEQFLTPEEYAGKLDEGRKANVYYTVDPQSQYISLYREQDIPVVLLPTLIDNHFISFLERKNTDIKYKRIDASVEDLTADEVVVENTEGLVEFFSGFAEGLKVEAKALKNPSLPAIALLDEQSRRMQEMSKMFGGGMGSFPIEKTLCLNLSNPLIRALNDNNDADLAKIVVDMALVAHDPVGEGARLEGILKGYAEVLAK